MVPGHEEQGLCYTVLTILLQLQQRSSRIRIVGSSSLNGSICSIRLGDFTNYQLSRLIQYCIAILLVLFIKYQLISRFQKRYCSRERVTETNEPNKNDEDHLQQKYSRTSSIERDQYLTHSLTHSIKPRSMIDDLHQGEGLMF